MNDLPPGLLRSITWDQGTEMARHTEIAESLRTTIYFCDSRSPWQRASNENTTSRRPPTSTRTHQST
jgi:transposase, IS30 family